MLFATGSTTIHTEQAEAMMKALSNASLPSTAASIVSPEETEMPKLSGIDIDSSKVQIENSQLENLDDEIMPSIGSIAHASGKCIPCILWFQLKCTKGVYCRYCHLLHPGQKKKRIRRSKNVRFALRTANGENGTQCGPPAEVQDSEGMRVPSPL